VDVVDETTIDFCANDGEVITREIAIKLAEIKRYI
jgi:hypothetical protein